MAVEPGRELAQVQKTPITIGARGLEINSLEQLYRFGQYAIESGWLPAAYKKPAQVVIGGQMAYELGLALMQGLASIAVINGKATLWGDARQGIIMRSGKLTKSKRWWTGEGDTRTAHCFMARGEIEEEREFSIADAKRAGLLGKDTYKQWTDDMLMRRATWRVQAYLFADYMAGIIPGDIEEVVEAERSVKRVDCEVVQEIAPQIGQNAMDRFLSEKKEPDPVADPETGEIPDDDAPLWESPPPAAEPAPEGAYNTEAWRAKMRALKAKKRVPDDKWKVWLSNAGCMDPDASNALEMLSDEVAERFKILTEEG